MLLFRTDDEQLRPMGRSARGVRAMKMSPGARLVGLAILRGPSEEDTSEEGAAKDTAAAVHGTAEPADEADEDAPLEEEGEDEEDNVEEEELELDLPPGSSQDCLLLVTQQVGCTRGV